MCVGSLGWNRASAAVSGYDQSMRLRWLAVVLSACLFGVASPCFGWGGMGHQIVALIAEDHLSPAAKAGIRDLLGGDAQISDAEVASWADEVRRQRRETAPWHYVNIPADATGFDRKRDGRDGDNVVDA